jgi:uncharacterized protein YdhG (YjbR/CyaY superfamily)
MTGATTPDEPADGFSPEERAAMKQRSREVRGRKGAAAVDPEAEVLEKIAAMSDSDRALAVQVHAIVLRAVPDLTPRLWYGMPAYSRGGTMICFFQDAAKFKARYATLGFSDAARLDDGEMWPASYAITALTPEVEERIVELVRRAAG